MSKKNKPRTIKILGWNYRVTKAYTAAQIDGAGELAVKEGELRIAKDVCKQAQESILIHEIIEGLNYHLALNLKHDTIDRLEGGFYAVLRDNKVDISKLLK